jgi:hypothetical protein
VGSLWAGTTVNLEALGIPSLSIKILQMAGLTLRLSPAICTRFELVAVNCIERLLWT